MRKSAWRRRLKSMSAMILLTLGNGCALHPDTSNAKSAISCNREQHPDIDTCVSKAYEETTTLLTLRFGTQSFALRWQYNMTVQYTFIRLLPFSMHIGSRGSCGRNLHFLYFIPKIHNATTIPACPKRPLGCRCVDEACKTM